MNLERITFAPEVAAVVATATTVATATLPAVRTGAQSQDAFLISTAAVLGINATNWVFNRESNELFPIKDILNNYTMMADDVAAVQTPIIAGAVADIFGSILSNTMVAVPDDQAEALQVALAQEAALAQAPVAQVAQVAQAPVVTEEVQTPVAPVAPVATEDSINAEIQALQVRLAELQGTASQNTNTIQGGTNMQTTVQNQPEVAVNQEERKMKLIASFQQGLITYDELQSLLAAPQIMPTGTQAPQTTTGAVANLVNSGVAAAGTVVTGTVSAVGQLLNSFVGAGNQIVAGQSGQPNPLLTKTLDGAHTVVGSTISTTVQVGSQITQVGATVATQTIDVTANVSKQLVSAGAEIVNTLLGGLGDAAHTINNNAYVAGNSLLNGGNKTLTPEQEARLAAYRANK